LVLGRIRVRPAQDEDHVRPVEPGRPHLLPGHHDLVTDDDAAGLHAPEVGSVLRLGEALAVDVLGGDDPGQEVLLLLLGAVHHDRRADHVLAEPPADAGQARARQLLAEDRVLHRREPPAAEALGPLGADPPAFQQAPVPLRVAGVGLRALPRRAVAAGHRRGRPVDQLGEPGGGVAGDPVADLRPEGGGLRPQVEFHQFLPVTTSTSSASTSLPSTRSGLISSVRRAGPSRVAAAAIAVTTPATRSRSTGRAPRAPVSTAAPRSSPSIRRTCASSTGSSRSATSCSTSTNTPPRPTASTGPNDGSTVTPTKSSVARGRIGLTSTPSTAAVAARPAARTRAN